MVPRPDVRRTLIGLWLTVAAVAIGVVIFRPDVLRHQLQHAFGLPLAAGYVVYLLLGCVRGFTFVPSTYLVLAAVPLLPPAPLFALTIAGILVSSASIYRFSESLHLADVFERRHGAQVARLKRVLAEHELPIIIGWSVFPLAPTDLICYVCGALKIHFGKCLLGVAIGEGAICGLYIFLGDSVLRLLHLRT